jgi:hypothetical protein
MLIAWWGRQLLEIVVVIDYRCTYATVSCDGLDNNNQ